MAQFVRPRTTVPIGTTLFVQAVSKTTLHTLGVQSDITAWTLPGTLKVLLESSFDNGLTYGHPAVGASRNGPPSADDDGGPATQMGFSATWTDDHAPDHLRLTVIVTGNPIPLGPTTITTG